MNKKKLKCIEDYIFAKTLNLLAKNTNVSRENAENFNIVNIALNKSEILLKENLKQINKLKLNNVSLLVLKQELETANIYSNSEINLIKLKEMIEKKHLY